MKCNVVLRARLAFGADRQGALPGAARHRLRSEKPLSVTRKHAICPPNLSSVIPGNIICHPFEGGQILDSVAVSLGGGGRGHDLDGSPLESYVVERSTIEFSGTRRSAVSSAGPPQGERKDQRD